MTINTPLKKYLVENGLSEVEFARQLSLVRGWVSKQPQISSWASGKRKPSKVNRYAIASATRGAVSFASWDKFKAFKRAA